MESNEEYMPVTVEVEDDTSEAGGPLSTYKNCKKNPSHKQFSSVSNFGVDHVPSIPSYLRQSVVSWVKVWAALVVRVSVAQISVNRLDTWDDQKPYPFAEFRGLSVRNMGSGWVHSVSCPQHRPCQCQHCNSSEERRNKFWEIGILTARHVVYDDIEAKKCEVVLFDELEDGTGTYTLTGGTVRDAKIVKDYCELICYTHDEDLVGGLQRLFALRQERDALMKQKLRDINKQRKEVVSTLQSPDKMRKPGHWLASLVSAFVQGLIWMVNLLCSMFITWCSMRSQDPLLPAKIRLPALPILAFNYGCRSILGALGLLALVNIADDKMYEIPDKAAAMEIFTPRFDIDDRSRLMLREARDKCEEKTLKKVLNEACDHQYNLNYAEKQAFEQLLHVCQKAGQASDRLRGISFSSSPVFVISHPHGRMKHISVGDFKHKQGDSLIYSTPTCRGSSGGLVLSLAIPEFTQALEYDQLLFCCPHKGSVANRLGRSSDWLYLVPE